jgi:hypothetical protein
MKLKEHGASVVDAHEEALTFVISAFVKDLTIQKLVRDGIISTECSLHFDIVKPAWLTESLMESPPKCLSLNKFYQEETTAPKEEAPPERQSSLTECGHGGNEHLCVLEALKRHYPVQHKNYELVKQLKQLRIFERAVGGEDISKQTGKAEYVNYRQLVLAQAITSLKHSEAIDFDSIRHDDVYKTAMSLPFINKSTAEKIETIVANGTCQTLLEHQKNGPVRSTSGEIRTNTEGA